MTTKPNPGCDIPEIKLPPGLQNFLQNLATDATAKALTTPAVQQAARAKQLVDSKTALLEREAKRAQKAKEQLEKFQKIPCPLPAVPDKAAVPGS